MHYSGRQFSGAEVEVIRALIAAEPERSRYKLSIAVCKALEWYRIDGRLKDMSCRVALLRMQDDGIISLPPAKRARPITYGVHPDIELAVAEPAIIPVIDLACLTIEPVGTQRESRLWNAYIMHHHYLGHQLIPGAQIRYFVRAGAEVIALLSFGASAWKTKPRDEYIGWNAAQRVQNLHLVVNNSRFLILPWIRHGNLASRILAMIARRLPGDWQTRYSYRPVLLETFVEKDRFRGTCYQAANWHRLGITQGRGKLDTHHQNSAPVKSVWVYPLVKDFRRHLCD